MSGSKLITNLHAESPYVRATGLKSIAVDNGRFIEIEDLPLETEVIDVDHAFVLPGFVDNHTHLVHAASREEEFLMKIEGRSYEEIAAAGGGIHNSARKLQDLSEEALFHRACWRMDAVRKAGTTAIEIKSGYGLTVQDELKMLRVIRRLQKAYPDMLIRPTLLAAHALPIAYQSNRSLWIDIICEELIPAAAEAKLAYFIDVFCEKGFFTVDETAKILAKGAEVGLKAKIHGNQLAVSGGVQVAVEHEAVSVDHLEQITETEIKLLVSSKTIPVGLPGCSFYLGIPYAPGRELLERGLPFALASDFNPGSSPLYDMQKIWSLACIKMKLSPQQALDAITCNSAMAMDAGEEVGSIKVGQRANLVILQKEIQNLSYVPYSFGENNIDKVMVYGEWVA
ncbi:MAG: imidazolonepropionase [Saprospirales bacterium]|nr:imidazolonepropionase [Saprospirales bacterium]|tara:strand:+ start:38 stop:1228 length:1191 start_codon:yes stop_codon:yes gene_type:complete